MSDDTTTDPRLLSEPEPHRRLLCCDPADVDQLLERVRQLLAEPSTPITWEADHCNIVSDFPRQVMLEAIKRLVSEPPETAARAELAAIRAMIEEPHQRTAAAGITPGAPLREHIVRLLARLRFDHEERCSVVVRNLQDTRARLAEALAGWESERHEVAALRAGHVPPPSDLERRLARAEQAASTYHAWLRVLAHDWSDGRRNRKVVAAGQAVTGRSYEQVLEFVEQPWREVFPLPAVGAAPGHLLADSAVPEPPSLPTNPAGPALDLDRLEATARAAQAMAPGPYAVDWLDFDDESGNVGRGIYDITDANKEQVVCGDNGVYPPRGALAEHIAGTSPDVVLRLIELAREDAFRGDLPGTAQEPAAARSATFACGWELCRASVTLVLPEAGDRPEEDDPAAWCPKCPRCLRRMDLAPPPEQA